MLPDSAYVQKIILGSIPLMLCLTFFLFETYQRSKLPPYVLANNNEEIGSYVIDLRGVVFLFLWVALLCAIILVYCLHTMPRKKVLLRRYLEEGQSVSGDVFYPEDKTCFGLCTPYGTVTYVDPRRIGHRNAYIRRSVRLFETFSREWISILVLPDRPYSGQPQSDLEMAYLATDREKDGRYFLASYAAIWMLANIAAAIYVLSVVQRNQYENEFPNGWIYVVLCLALMPILAIGANFIFFQRYMRWMTKGDARVLEKSEAEGFATAGSGKKSSGKPATSDYEQMDHTNDQKVPLS